jgi:hypothetical protein
MLVGTLPVRRTAREGGEEATLVKQPVELAAMSKFREVRRVRRRGHRHPAAPREDGLTHPADASRCNIAVLGLLSRRLSNRVSVSSSRGAAVERGHHTCRERTGSPTLQTPIDPIF